MVRGRHRPILLVLEGGHVFALDNRCPHMGFPLDRGSIDDGILTCHWHHARFELASGCTFDLWADDVPTCPVEIRAGGKIWVRPVFGYADPVKHWRQRLANESPTISASSSPRPYTVSWRRADHRRRWYDKRLCSAPAIVMAGAWGSPFLPHSVNFRFCRMRERHLAAFSRV